MMKMRRRIISDANTKRLRFYNKLKIAIICSVLILACLLPPLLVETIYYLRVIVAIWINAIVALGLNFCVGVCGQISLGQAAFVGTSAYVLAILVTKQGAPWILAILVSLISVVFLGLAVGLVSTRLRGPYLAIVTLAFNLVFVIVLTNELNITGGPFGIRVNPPQVLGLTIDVKLMYFLAFGCLIALYQLGRVVYFSKIGRGFRATRDDELAARVMGINTVMTKTQAFMISAIYAGIAGVLQTLTYRFIAPTSFTVIQSFRYLAMVVIGGMGYLPGSIVGAAIVTVVPELFRGLAGFWDIILGSTILAILLFFPKGAGFFPEYFKSLIARSKVEERWTGEIDISDI